MAVIQQPLPAAIPSVRWTAVRSNRAWLRAALGVPLQVKVLGANIIVVVIAVTVLLTPLGTGAVRLQDLILVCGALALGSGVSYALIRLALKPVQDLEQIARRVSQGRMSERVPPSLVADPDLAHLAETMNDMLDTLAAGRERMRKLGAEVVYAQERERAQVARDLHDSVAQTLAAASFQIAAAANEIGGEAGSSQLTAARDLMRTALEEIRTVSRSLHPRVADDLGLPEALEALADATRQRSLIDVKVKTNVMGVTIPASVSSTLYRVAQEALRDVERYADAGTAEVSLAVHCSVLELAVQDDGCELDGFAERANANPVLKRMRERLSLAGGDLHIHRTVDSGTRVVATVRLGTEAA
jgi:signal transduction histidine kinase